MINFKKYFKIDKKSKSLSFFYQGSLNINVNNELINEIKKIAFNKKKNLRLNLHNKNNDSFHNMIIFQWKGTYIRPHKHLYKEETCHMIEGKQQIIILDDNGLNIDNCNLSVDENIIYRINKNTYHTSYIISEYVIFHESKPGPYLGNEDSIYPLWSPSSNNKLEQKEYMYKIYSEKK